MVYTFYNSSSSSGFDISTLFSPSFHDYGASKSNDVLESEKGEIMKCPAARVGKVDEKNSEANALAALKSHREAERRRRERINAHLETLHNLVPPSTDKMDKATILAKVISQVKELKKNALEASNGLLIPEDADEVEVEPCNDDDDDDDGSMSYKASICCDYRPEILSDLRNTIEALQLQLVRAEMSTLEGRMKNVFVYKCCKGGSNGDTESCQALASSVSKALSSVLEKASFSLEYSLRASSLPPSKRRRICFLATSSTSSCNHDSCLC